MVIQVILHYSITAAALHEVDLVEPDWVAETGSLTLRVPTYSHIFPQPVSAGSLTCVDLLLVPSTCATIHRAAPDVSEMINAARSILCSLCYVQHASCYPQSSIHH